MYSHNTFLLEPRDYGRPVKKSTSLHSLKSNPNPTYLVTAKAYFVCHISPNFHISLIFAFIGSPLSVLDPVIIKELPSHLLDSINNFNYFSATTKNRYCEIAKVSRQSQAIGYGFTMISKMWISKNLSFCFLCCWGLEFILSLLYSYIYSHRT